MAMTDVTDGAAVVVVAAAGAATAAVVARCLTRCLGAAEAVLAANGTTARARAATVATRRVFRAGRLVFMLIVSEPHPPGMIPQNVGVIELVSDATDH